MTGSAFMRHLANGERDAVALLLDLLRETDARYCLIGGLAVNAYAEPVVSLDLDLVVVASAADAVVSAARARGWRVESFPHSINLSVAGSDLRIQIQTDSRYQSFLPRAERHKVLGYDLMVACVEDVLHGKIWAYLDRARRASKRQKDLADIMRLAESHPRLLSLIPAEIQSLIQSS